MSETLLQTPELLDVPDIDVGFELDLSERLRARLRARLFNPGVTPPRPEPRFFINGVGISTAGNLTALSAAVKNGKSGFIAAMVAAATNALDHAADIAKAQDRNGSGTHTLRPPGFMTGARAVLKTARRLGWRIDERRDRGGRQGGDRVAVAGAVAPEWPSLSITPQDLRVPGT